MLWQGNWSTITVLLSNPVPLAPTQHCVHFAHTLIKGHTFCLYSDQGPGMVNAAITVIIIIILCQVTDVSKWSQDPNPDRYLESETQRWPRHLQEFSLISNADRAKNEWTPCPWYLSNINGHDLETRYTSMNPLEKPKYKWDSTMPHLPAIWQEASREKGTFLG